MSANSFTKTFKRFAIAVPVSLVLASGAALPRQGSAARQNKAHRHRDGKTFKGFRETICAHGSMPLNGFFRPFRPAHRPIGTGAPTLKASRRAIRIGAPSFAYSWNSA